MILINRISGSARLKGVLSWQPILGVAIATSLIRLRLLGIPLERDEGEYAYIAQLILKGIPPYLTAYSMKLPGIFFAYALNMSIFGQSIEGIHLGLIFVNVATIMLVFVLAKRLFGLYGGLVAGASFAVLALGKTVLGLTANSEHFVLLPVMAGLLLLLRAIDIQKGRAFLLSGLFFGLAFLVKQHGVFFILFGIFYIFWAHRAIRRVSWAQTVKNALSFGMGSLVPFAVTCVVFYRIGIFDKFWFQTFTYARSYIEYASFYTAISSFLWTFNDVVRTSPFLWALAVVGLVSVFLEREARANAVFFIGFFITSFAVITPGLYFRNHYFILVLPAVSFLIAVAAHAGQRLLANSRTFGRSAIAISMLLFILAAGHSIFSQREFLFRMNPTEASRDMYGPHLSPFPETAAVASYIKEHSSKSDSVVVMGSEPQIYFYLDRPAPTGYLYAYFLTEQHPYYLKMQDEFIKDVEKASPRYLVYLRSWNSEFVSKDAFMRLYKWYENYKMSYDIVGIADIISKDRTEYRWGEDAKNYTHRGKLYVLVFKRKP